MAERNQEFFDAGVLARAQDLWRGHPSQLSRGMIFATGHPEGMENWERVGQGAEHTETKKQTKFASALLDAVGRAPKNEVTLYRGVYPDEGDAHSPVEDRFTPLASWSSRSSVAAKFAKERGGKVVTAKPGTVSALKNRTGAFDEEEYLVPRYGHKYWQDRREQ